MLYSQDGHLAEKSVTCVYDVWEIFKLVTSVNHEVIARHDQPFDLSKWIVHSKREKKSEHNIHTTLPSCNDSSVGNVL